MILPGVIASGGGVASSYESIASTTLTSTATSVTFSSIPGTFSHLQVRIMMLNATASNVWTRPNNSTATSYAGHDLLGDGSNAYSGNYTSNNEGIFTGFCPGSASVSTVSIQDILDYTSTNKNKTFRTLTGRDLNGSGAVELRSGLWYATPVAITSLVIYAQSGTFAINSSFALYGVKA